MPRRNSFSQYQEGGRSRGEGRPVGEGYIPRKKTCRFCADKQLRIDYKDGKALKPYITEREKVAPSRITGLCAYHQRRMMEAIKRARILGLIPFSSIQRQTI